MPTPRIFSRDINLQGYILKNYIQNPMTTAARTALSLGVADEGFITWDTDANAPYWWDGSAWQTWPAGGGGDDFLNISYDDLQNLTGGSTTVPYYMTTPGKEGFWIYTGTVADETTDNEGTVIVTADLKQYKRIYDGVLDIRWFGGVADYAPSGTNMTGTNNITALNKMFAAAKDNQRMLVPRDGTGWYFNGSMTTLTNAKIANLTIEGDTYHFLATPSTPFINMVDVGKEHKIYHRGRAFGKLGLPDVSKANYDNNTGPDWDAMNGILIRCLDIVKPRIEVMFADGFAEVIRLEGGTTSAAGTQEVEVKYNWLYRNKYGIRFVVTDGSGFVDKNLIYGGRIMGQYPISFEGNLGGVSKTGVFTANSFFNVLIEAAETAITGTGVIRYNSFISCQIEGGATTGVYSNTKIDLGPAAFSNSFIGNETFRLDWFNNPGEHLMISSTGLFSNNDVIVGGNILGGITNGRITTVGTQGISNNTRNNIPSFVDHITFLGTSPVSNESRLNEFAHVRVNGVEQSVSYDGKYVSVSSAGTTTLVPPTGYVRLAAGTGNVVLAIDPTQLYNGSSFYIEQTGTGTVEIQNSSDSTVVMSTSQITSTGIYYVRFVGSTFTATKLGGTGTVSFTAIGSAPNANGASVSGSVVTLQPANASFGGVILNGAQDIPGAKQFLADLTVRRTVATNLNVDNTSATESTITSLNLTNIVGGAFIKVNNNSIAELGRKDNTATAAYVLSNGKVFGTGRQWSLGINPGNNHFIINNQALASNALSIQSANNNIRIGTSTTDPGVKLQVDGDFRTTGQLYLGSAASDPLSGTNGQMYYNSTSNKFRAFENSVWVDVIGTGGGGGGVNAIGAVGSGNNLGASISGTTLSLHLATSTQPGLWGTGTQTLAGVKTFTGTHIFRSNTTASGTAPFKIVEGSALMNVIEDGSIERFGQDLWFTNNIVRSKIITTDNVAVLFNKTWQSNPIDKTYISGSGGAANQSIRRNAANTDWEWYTPASGGGTTETASNGLQKIVNDIQLGGTMTSNTTILGASRNIDWGTTGSMLNNFNVNAVALVVNAGIKLTKVTISNTAFSLSTSTNYVELANTLTANRALTFPTPASGQIIIVHNKSTSGSFQYTVVGSYRLGSTGTTTANLPNNTVIQFLGTGTEWIAMNK